MSVKEVEKKSLPKPKRYRSSRETIKGVTNPAIKRLARRGGVKRLSNKVCDEVRATLKAFVAQVMKDAVLYTEHSNRKTVTPADIVHALKRQGKSIYGFGGD
jgi:histone H4